MPEIARRLLQLPPYVFDRLAHIREEAKARGEPVIDLSVGNPDGRPPLGVIEAMQGALEDPDENVHRYPPLRGAPGFRRAVSDWYDRRFNVHLDPSHEVLPVLGSKEGLYHLMQTFLDPEDVILIPTPCYPAYLGAARLCQAQIVELPLCEQDDFVLRFDQIPRNAARAAKLLLLNYPGNPTGGVCDLDHYRQAIAFCREHDILLVSDIAYAELSLDDTHVPASVLELPGAREQAVEFGSLSKSHNMAGWRIGYCVGGSEIVDKLARLKANVDFGIFSAIQRAAETALRGDDRVVRENRRRYRTRRDHLCAGLQGLGWPVRVPRAGMYVWTPVPPTWGNDDAGFVETLFERTRVLVSPGSAFGEAGQGWVRISLVVDESQLGQVVERLSDSGIFHV